MTGKDKQAKSRAERTAILAVIAGMVTILIYLPALKNGFVNWDDPVYVYENLDIRLSGLKFSRWVLTASVAGNWHPLTMASYALDYSLWGLDPPGYHLVNIVVHSVNTMLVFILAQSLLGSRSGFKSITGIGASFIAALLFGVHPLHVESVAWISERKDVLCALFFLLTVISYVKYASNTGKGYHYVFSLIFFVLAIISKPMAMTIPAVLLILDFYPLERLSERRQVILEKIPFFILSILSAGIAIWAQKKGAALAPFAPYPVNDRIVIAVKAYVFYLYKTLLPLNLIPYYPRPLDLSLLSPGFLISAFVLFTITVLAAASRLRKIYLAVWLYYIITLIPVVGLVQIGDQAAADRYAYLPNLGIFLLAGAGVEFLLMEGKSLLARVFFGGTAVIIFAVLSILTFRQIAIWKDSITLWSHEIEISENARAYLNRALAYDRLKEYERALSDYNRAEELSLRYKGPYINYEHLDALINRGIVYGEMGRYLEALDELNKAIRIDPTSSYAYQNRGAAYLSIGELARAEEDLKKTLDLDPGNYYAHYNLALTYSAAGQASDADYHFKKAASMGLKEAQDYLKKRGEGPDRQP